MFKSFFPSPKWFFLSVAQQQVARDLGCDNAVQPEVPRSLQRATAKPCPVPVVRAFRMRPATGQRRPGKPDRNRRRAAGAKQAGRPVRHHEQRDTDRNRRELPRSFHRVRKLRYGRRRAVRASAERLQAAAAQRTTQRFVATDCDSLWTSEPISTPSPTSCSSVR